MRGRTLILLAAPVLLTGALAVPARAQDGAGGEREPAPPSEQMVQGLIDRLGSDELREREDAMLELIDLPGLQLSRIEGAMTDPSLSAEQLLRLRRVAVSVFTYAPKAGMGVTFDTRSPLGVSVSSTQPGFPVDGLLKPGDVIVAMDGQLIRSSLDARAVILSHLPGEVLDALVQRDGEQMLIPVPLVSFEQLQLTGNAQIPSPADYELAYRYRSVRLGTDDELDPRAAVGADIERGDWIAVERGEQGARSETPPNIGAYRDLIASLAAEQSRLENGILTLSGLLTQNEFEDDEERRGVKEQLDEARDRLNQVVQQMRDLTPRSQP